MTNEQTQNLLQYLGYYTGRIDGIWGRDTASAVAKFCKAYGISLDEPTTVMQKALIGAVAGMMEKVQSTGFWDNYRSFSKEEFRCKCPKCVGTDPDMNEEVVKAAQKIRDYFARPVIVSSGLRCKEHNAEVGGVYNSKHLTGEAVDFCVTGIHSVNVINYIKRSIPEIKYVYAINDSYVHMNV